EAHCVCQILEESGVQCEVVGDHLESTFGLAAPWNVTSVLVSEDDAKQARGIIADRLALCALDAPQNAALQYGLRAMLVNFTCIAIILALYRPLDQAWTAFALLAFQTLVVGNVLAFRYFRKRRRAVEDGDESRVNS
ncbi:MAG TPA: DUF2007 domain-containing protein, partial [Lacipirellulaceae bacterium]|nr:DUF2007 domain-containing protein [Lacipirellulaceae bacterium]